MKNKTVVFPELVAGLSDLTHTSAALCESFIKELCSLIESKLENGESVRIKKIGVFRMQEREIVFVPDKELSESVNAAFECFEPIELDQDVKEEDLIFPEDSAEEGELSSTSPASAEKEEVRDADPEEVFPEPSPEADQSQTYFQPQEALPKDIDAPVAEYSKAQSAELQTVVRKSRFWTGYVLGFFSAAVLCGIGLLSTWKLGGQRETEDAVLVTEVVMDSVPDMAKSPAVLENSDSVSREAKADEAPKWPQLYKVTSSAYLSNVSRKFYGHYAFWIYIYLENEDRIEDPDCLPVGIVLEIPDPEKYGIDKDDPESIRKAERKAIEILDL